MVPDALTNYLLTTHQLLTTDLPTKVASVVPDALREQSWLPIYTGHALPPQVRVRGRGRGRGRARP